jgi:hypothetical protein
MVQVGPPKKVGKTQAKDLGRVLEVGYYCLGLTGQRRKVRIQEIDFQSGRGRLVRVS